ncbi:MAG: hypothetical protein LBT09_14870 [Planctomycetaceae bacterium]|nr:hypothetical protein [Planctomycetaceae bacterium]
MKNLRDKLLKGETLTINQNGLVSDDNNNSNETSMPIPKGKLAVRQWYERDPQLLQDEKTAMNMKFPSFTLTKLGGGDNRLAWHGELRIGTFRKFAWKIAAIYNNDHPIKIMGTSVKIILMEPTIESLTQQIGWTPPHVLHSEEDGYYLCTARAEDVQADERVTSAAQCIAFAGKWLFAMELCIHGLLTREAFSRHNFI